MKTLITSNIFKKAMIIVILLVRIEEEQPVFVISDIQFLLKFQLCSIIAQKTIFISLLSTQQKFLIQLILGLECSVFLKNFKKKFLFWYFYSFLKDLSRECLFISKFLLEVPKFKENSLTCIITVIKMFDLLLTLL